MISLSSYLEEIINSVNNINHTIGSRFDNDSTLYKLVSNIYLKCNSLYFSVRNIETYFKLFIETYFPISNGSSQITSWHNFWDSFNSLSLHDFIINIYNEIDNLTNPLSEQNKPAFDLALNDFKTNTFLGSCYDVVEQGNNLVNSLNVESSAQIVSHTLPAEFFGVVFPAREVVIDFSWYAPYREAAHKILSAFIWIGFLWRFVTVTIFKLINGVEGGFVNYEQMSEPEFTTRDNFTVDSDGTVKSHSTVYSYKDGHTVTQKHDV